MITQSYEKVLHKCKHNEVFGAPLVILGQVLYYCKKNLSFRQILAKWGAGGCNFAGK